MSIKIFRPNTNPFAVVFYEKVYTDMLNGPCEVGPCKADGIHIPTVPAGNLGGRSTIRYINQVHAR